MKTWLTQPILSCHENLALPSWLDLKSWIIYSVFSYHKDLTLCFDLTCPEVQIHLTTVVLPFHEDLTLSSWSPSSSIQSCLGMKTRLFHLDLTCHEVLANPSSLVLSWGPEVTEQSVMRLCCLICTKLVCHKISSEDSLPWDWAINLCNTLSVMR